MAQLKQDLKKYLALNHHTYFSHRGYRMGKNLVSVFEILYMFHGAQYMSDDQNI